MQLHANQINAIHFRQQNEVCLRAPVSESLTRLQRDQLQKFAQYLISELPQQILPTAQRLLDELLRYLKFNRKVCYYLYYCIFHNITPAASQRQLIQSVVLPIQLRALPSTNRPTGIWTKRRSTTTSRRYS